MGRKSIYSPEFKSKVALEALKEQKTLSELAKEFSISPEKIKQWKSEFIRNSSKVFQSESNTDEHKLQAKVQRLESKVGQLTMGVDFLQKPTRKPVSKRNETTRNKKAQRTFQAENLPISPNKQK